MARKYSVILSEITAGNDVNTPNKAIDQSGTIKRCAICGESLIAFKYQYLYQIICLGLISAQTNKFRFDRHSLLSVCEVK